jgi:two-component sensor histidine kinase
LPYICYKDSANRKSNQKNTYDPETRTYKCVKNNSNSDEIKIIPQDTTRTIKEIHHRVKNNLQTVSALLRLQSRRVTDPIASAALDEAVRRVGSIALVHETLSNQSSEFVEFDSVFEQIIKNSLDLSPRKIEFNKVGNFGSFDSKTATALSLIITELIHNALEHGLTHSGNSLTVEIDRDRNKYVVSVCDDGPGFSEGFSIEKSANLGLQIVNTLTKNELNGNLILNRINNLTKAEVVFGIN